MNIIFPVLLELLFVSSLIILLHKLKSRFGLVPLFVLLGSIQYMQTILSQSFYIRILGTYSISPGSAILFSSSLFAILLIYLREGTAKTQQLIIGIITANLAFTTLAWITGLQIDSMNDILVQGKFYPQLFRVNMRIFLVGTVVLAIDAVLIVILYEFIFTRFKKLNAFLRILITLVLVTNFDAIAFTLGSFGEKPDILDRLAAQMGGKSIAAIFYSVVLFVYLKYLSSQNKDKTESGKEDIFSILTFRGKYEKLKEAKKESEQAWKDVLSEKNKELEDSIERFIILSSARDLRIDKYTSEEQLSAFLGKVKDAFKVDACIVRIIRDNQLKLMSQVGVKDWPLDEYLPLDKGMASEIINNRKALSITDIAGFYKHINLDVDQPLLPFKSYAGTPLMLDNKIIGILAIYTIHEIHEFTDLELEHLQLVGAQMAHAFENARLYEQNEKHKEVLVKQIMARKKTEELLKSSEYKYKQIVETAQEGVWMIDKEFNTQYVNNKMAEMLGYSVEEMAGKRFLSFVDQEGIENAIRHIENRRKGLTEQLDLKFIRKDGTHIWGLIETSPVVQDKAYQGSLVMVTDITQRRASEQALRNSEEELRALTRHLNNVREEERINIARDIHDQLGQQLTVMKMDITWINKKLHPRDEFIQARIDNLLEILADTMKSVRQISANLRPNVLDDLGLVAAMEWLLEDFEKRSGIPIRFINHFGDKKVSTEISTSMFRILQESLTNINRHANASEVTITLEERNGYLFLEIKDDGVGFDPAKMQEKTLGLLGMKERALIVKGHFDIITNPGAGTVINVYAPLHA